MERIHCDLWGRTQCSSINGNNYVICFVDDFSRHITIKFLKRKSDAAAALREYIDEFSVPLQINIRMIQSDAGGEFHGDFANTCKIHGIRQTFSAPEVQAQNSVAERTWSTLVAATLRMLEDSQLPAKYFEDAMTTAAWIKNRVYSTAVDGMTPHEAMWNEKPDMSLLKVWGSPAYVHIPHGKKVKLKHGSDAERKQKLNSKVRPAVFVGYAPQHKAWRFYDPNTACYLTSRVATFNERVNDSTPTLTLLKQKQPTELELSTLEGDLAPTLTTTGANDSHEDHEQLEPPTLPMHTSTESALEGREKGTSTVTGNVQNTGPLTTSEVRWMPTPRDNMTVKQIARHFNVDYPTYHRWMSTFSPFGTDKKGRDEDMKLTRIGKAKNPTRLERGTDVPIPIGDTTFIAAFAATEQQRKQHSARQCHNTVVDSTAMFAAFSMSVTAIYHTLVTPANFGKIKESKERDKWWDSMNSEYTSLIGLGTWELVPRKPGEKVIGCMWAYKIKEKKSGEIDKFKSRLVARGDQQADSSFTDIFAPVIKFTTLRILLAIACVMDWDLQQIDIGNAYCNAHLTSDRILMRQPPGFEQYGPNGEELVCLLRKTLYGLKQSGRSWNALLNSWLTQSKWKLKRCRSDHCLYYANHNGKVLIVGCYVDDLVITGNDPALIREFKTDIGNRFKIADLGDLQWILGMEVVRDRKKKTLTLHQRKYINDILELFGMKDCHPRTTPADSSTRLSKEDSPTTEAEKSKCNITDYRARVGKLVYLMVGSAPAISFAVSQLSTWIHQKLY